MRPGKLAIVAIAVAILTIGLSAAIGDNRSRADQVAAQAIEMQIQHGASEIDISGQISSPAHEAILLEVLAQRAPHLSVSIDLSEAYLSPPGWALVTELALQATLLTQFSETNIDATGVAIRGVTNDPAAWALAVKRLQASLLPGMRFESRVVELATAPAFTSLCREQFTAAIRQGSLQFSVGRSEIETDARALLDSLNETAADCTRWNIKVRVGGNGSSSDESDLAAARVQSIITYLTEHGLPPQRIAAAADTATGRYGQATFSVSMEDAAQD